MRAFWITATALYTTVVAAVRPYSEWMSDSFIQKGVNLSFAYAPATLYNGIEKTYNATHNASYSEFLTAQIDGILNPNGTIKGYRPTAYSLDDLRIGTIILSLWTRTGKEKYKTAADQLRSQLETQPRTASGGFWHRSPKYPNQMWLDGLYMASPFYAQYTALFSPANNTAWNDIALQFALVEAHCRNTTSGLLAHGYDESKTAVWADGTTGASPHVWIRAVGWYFMALVDILEWFPVSHPSRSKLLAYFTTLAAALRKAQDAASGGWWLVMDEPYPGMPGNYIESSGTAMYTYSLLKGIRLGYIGAEYMGPAKRAYELLVDRFVARNGTNGTLNWEGTVLVGSLDQDASFKYYTSIPLSENDYKGVGPFISASVEFEKLNATLRNA